MIWGEYIFISLQNESGGGSRWAGSAGGAKPLRLAEGGVVEVEKKMGYR